MACHLYNTERCLQLQLFKRPNFGVHFNTVISKLGYILEKHLQNKDSCTKMPQL